jgi:hypothetical protein
VLASKPAVVRLPVACFFLSRCLCSLLTLTVARPAPFRSSSSPFARFLPKLELKPVMPANLRSRLSRLLGALLTLLASPLAASARLVVGSTGVTYAAKRFEPSGVSATYFECPNYGPDNVAPTLPEGTDNGVTTTCNYAFEGGCVPCSLLLPVLLPVSAAPDCCHASRLAVGQASRLRVRRCRRGLPRRRHRL